MWQSHLQELTQGRVHKYTITRNHEVLSYQDFIAGLIAEEGLRETFMAVLRESPFSAYFWESPSVSFANLERPFEFVLVKAAALDGVPADREPFSAFYKDAKAHDGITHFANLGGDAELVVPGPLADDAVYAHLAAFSRKAPEPQQHALWHKVGEVLLARLHEAPTWLSTSGLGVYWVHIRLDSRPKYYTFAPYRQG